MTLNAYVTNTSTWDSRGTWYDVRICRLPSRIIVHLASFEWFRNNPAHRVVPVNSVEWVLTFAPDSSTPVCRLQSGLPGEVPD